MPVPHAPARRSWPLALARAAGSLVALAALLVALPLALLRIGTLPAHLPTLGGIGDALMAPDDGGTVLFTVLTLACWALWAWFVLSLLLEAVALLRHRTAPRVRGLGAPQRLAAVLLGGLLVIPSTAALAATPATAVTHPATAAPVPGTGATSVSRTAAQHPSAHDGPRHVVGATGETVWDLAEQYLGDGRRHSELRALNPHLPQSATLPPGTVVNLPPGTTVRTELAATTTDKSGRAETYTVAAGDSLSAIADTELGDAGRWPDLYTANKNVIGSDPDLIFPGEHLSLAPQAAPAPEPAAPDGDGGGATDSQTSRPTDGDVPAAPQHAVPDDEDGGHDSVPEGPQNENRPEPSTPHEASGHTATGATAPSATASPAATATRVPADASPAQAVSPARIAAIGGSVLAAALLATLTTRRILQQRRRHHGHRIALPEGDAAATEQSLRTAEADLETSTLAAALRSAAVRLRDAGRELPQLAAAVLGPEEIELYLRVPAEPVPPFTADDDLRRWTCPARGVDLLPPEQRDNVEAPYPALVSLGWDERGHLVLVDLESSGHLHLTGPDRHRVLRTIALELAVSELADELTVVPVGQVAPGLQQEMPERVSACADLDAALSALRVHHAEQQRALDVLEAGTMRRARCGVDSAAAWSAHVVLAGDLDAPGGRAALEALRAVIAEQPRSATVLVTAGPDQDGTPDGAQTVHADLAAGPVSWTLPGTEVTVVCTVQVLSDEHYAQALEVLATTRAEDIALPQSPATAPRAVPDLPHPLDLPAPPPEPTGRTEFPGAEPATDARVDAVEAADRAVSQSPAGAGLMAQFAVFDDVPQESGAAQGAAAEGPEAGGSASPLPPAPGPEPVLPPTAAFPAAGTTRADLAGAPGPGHPDAPAPEDEPGEDGERPPHVLVLGPVEVDGPRGSVENKRRRTLIELAAWLVLHPGRDHHALDEALWPGKANVLKYRNATVSRLRSWLGTDDDGSPYLPRISTTTDARYSLAPAVGCDWHRFQHLTRSAGGPHAAARLRSALELVRGRPFSSIDHRRYAWAEHLAQDMISAIVDTAAELAEHCLATRDPRGALWAATKGLEAAPEEERLYRVVFRACAALGDNEGLQRAADRLEHLNMELGTDMEEATAVILSQLSNSA